MTPHPIPLASVQRNGILLAIAGAVAFSGKAIIVKLAYRYGVDAATLIMYRMLFALPLFLLMAWWAESRPQARAQPLGRRDWVGIIGLGFMGYYLSSYLDFIGLRYISAGLERLILFLTPSFVLLMSVFLLKKRVSRTEWLALAICYGGTVLVFLHDARTSGSEIGRAHV